MPTCMYACFYLCMYAFMYASMYIYIYMHVVMMHKISVGSMNVYLNLRKMHVCVHACMHVCICMWRIFGPTP